MRKVLLFAHLGPLLASAAGLIVTRNSSTWEFREVVAIQVNGKDRVRILNAGATRPEGFSKLPSEKLGSALVKDTAMGVPAIYDAGRPPQYVIPQELPKVPGDAPVLWMGARIGVKKTASDKVWAEIPAEEFAAFLPDGVGDLAGLVVDPGALRLLSGKDSMVATQISLLTAAVKAFGTDPKMASVELYVRKAMISAETQFDGGIDSVRSLDTGQQFARLSEEAYPALAEHDRLRKALAAKRKWLDRRVATLRAFGAGGAWDEFLISYMDFERHQDSFADVKALRQKALRESMNQHWTTGKARLADGELRPAYKEIQRASFRQPTNTILQKDLTVAWAEYSRYSATAAKNRRKQLSPGQRDAITQALDMATRYKDQNNLAEAAKRIEVAEQIDAQALALLLKKAEIVAARGELGQALAILDQYDQIAIDEERLAGNKLRNDVLFQLSNALTESHKALAESWGKKNIHQTKKVADEALRVSPTDADAFYYLGISSLVAREPGRGVELLRKYLDASNDLDADPARRAAVIRLLSSPGLSAAAIPTAKGEPNWLSARLLPGDVFYCPTGLAFQPKVEDIDADHLGVHFVWEKNRLKSIVSTFDKPQQSTGEKSVVFDYDDRVPQPVQVRYDDQTAAPAAKDLDELIHGGSVIFANHPLVDPLLFESVGGGNISIGVAGNRFFHPFVWQKLVFFRLRYDTEGRVSQAVELPSKDQASGQPMELEFDWNGARLEKIRGYQTGSGDSKPRALVYERTQQYLDNRLIGEEIHAGGKVSKIKYLYAGAQLVSAECDKDETVDGRSRRVVFVGGKNVKGK